MCREIDLAGPGERVFHALMVRIGAERASGAGRGVILFPRPAVIHEQDVAALHPRRSPRKPLRGGEVHLGDGARKRRGDRRTSCGKLGRGERMV